MYCTFGQIFSLNVCIFLKIIMDFIEETINCQIVIAYSFKINKLIN